MERLNYEFPAGAPASRRVLVGVVGSGDLEVMIEPGDTGKTQIDVTTSIDGYGRVWEAQLTRVFRAEERAAMKIRIHDFGATPGVVGMRLAEAFEALDGTGKPDNSSKADNSGTRSSSSPGNSGNSGKRDNSGTPGTPGSCGNSGNDKEQA